ncbi:hypothetical protein RSOL_271050 [Rhizoctonia solani AG-3 Rhs1AP]|uniref:Uncharacterized protein n=1 Tax=Rhizoctonia solani AG-3 Rhs1AP TaxID=1086054 RepID=A0A0A1UIM8_9AGAM|nr:hypothetical protein RSOL_271050 [Rhizoctonia solani AG-3 Rhs1AP]
MNRTRNPAEFLGKWLHPLLRWAKSDSEASLQTSVGTASAPGFTLPTEPDPTPASNPISTQVIDIIEPALVRALDRADEVTGRLEDAHKALVRIIDLVKDSDYLACNIHTHLKSLD